MIRIQYTIRYLILDRQLIHKQVRRVPDAVGHASIIRGRRGGRTTSFVSQPGEGRQRRTLHICLERRHYAGKFVPLFNEKKLS